MLCGKIYIDTDTDGQEMLVFESIAEEKDPIAVDRIAISPEAHEEFNLRFQRPDRFLDRFLGEFELFGYEDSWEPGFFHFKTKVEENGLRRRTLRQTDPLRVRVVRGCRRAVLGYMIPCENELLKELDLSSGIDEGVLWERYFTAARARGEMLACDADTIKRIPAAYLTEAQRNEVKQRYLARCEEFGDYHLHHHGDEVDAIVISELQKIYLKSGFDIRRIIGKEG